MKPPTPPRPPPAAPPEGRHDPDLLAVSESFMQEYANVKTKSVGRVKWSKVSRGARGEEQWPLEDVKRFGLMLHVRSPPPLIQPRPVQLTNPQTRDFQTQFRFFFFS